LPGMPPAGTNLLRPRHHRLSGALAVFLLGSGVVMAAEPLYPEWKLYVCALDASALPESQRLVADTLLRALLRALSPAERRIRDVTEQENYTALAWNAARQQAGAALAGKRAERDALFFKGYPAWKYRAELAKVTTAIEDLESEAAKLRDSPPQIVPEPALLVLGEGENGLFPVAPPRTGEADFCRQKNVDGLLTGAIDQYYGRLRLKLRLYGSVAASDLFAETVLFSPEDQGTVLAEIAGRLVAVLTNRTQAALAVTVQPAAALIVVDDQVVGRGSLAVWARGACNKFILNSF